MPDRLTSQDVPVRLDENGTPVFERKRNSAAYEIVELRGIESFEDARRLAEDRFGTVVDAASVMGTGFTVINGHEKDRLVGVDFIILSMDFNEGEQGPFVSFLAVGGDGQRYIVNDGSTGIYAQLDEWYVRTGKGGGLFVRGLRRSDYPATDDRPAGTTYYLNV